MAPARAADATTPIDYTRRNTPFAPGATVPLERKTLPTADAVQQKRVEITTRDKPASTLGDQRAAIDVTEARPKDVRAPESRRPETIETPRSAFDHRPAAIAPADETKKPPMVAKYQESLTAANAIKSTRTPAPSRATTATVNRFVFRKNSPQATGDAATGPPGAAVTPAAGGSPVRK